MRLRRWLKGPVCAQITPRRVVTHICLRNNCLEDHKPTEEHGRNRVSFTFQSQSRVLPALLIDKVWRQEKYTIGGRTVHFCLLISAMCTLSHGAIFKVLSIRHEKLSHVLKRVQSKTILYHNWEVNCKVCTRDFCSLRPRVHTETGFVEFLAWLFIPQVLPSSCISWHLGYWGHSLLIRGSTSSGVAAFFSLCIFQTHRCRW